MRQLFDILASCVYASGCGFIGYPWAYDFPLQKRVDFALLGVVMILLMAVVQVVVLNSQRNSRR